MERRTFVKAFGGLLVLSAFAPMSVLEMTGCSPARGSSLFTTADILLDGTQVGPVMQGGIDMVYDNASKQIVGCFEGTDFFKVDELGAALIRLADGTQDIQEITRIVAEDLQTPLKPGDVAQFFLSLGQAGFLRNRVELNLIENPA